VVILMGRILEETEEKVLIEPYGTYEDWYDSPDEDMRKWVKKSYIETINDEYVEDFSSFVNTEEVLEIALPQSQARRML